MGQFGLPVFLCNVKEQKRKKDTRTNVKEEELNDTEINSCVLYFLNHIFMFMIIMRCNSVEFFFDFLQADQAE